MGQVALPGRGSMVERSLGVRETAGPIPAAPIITPAKPAGFLFLKAVIPALSLAGSHIGSGIYGFPTTPPHRRWVDKPPKDHGDDG